VHARQTVDETAWLLRPRGQSTTSSMASRWGSAGGRHRAEHLEKFCPAAKFKAVRHVLQDEKTTTTCSFADCQRASTRCTRSGRRYDIRSTGTPAPRPPSSWTAPGPADVRRRPHRQSRPEAASNVPWRENIGCPALRPRLPEPGLGSERSGPSGQRAFINGAYPSMARGPI